MTSKKAKRPCMDKSDDSAVLAIVRAALEGNRGARAFLIEYWKPLAKIIRAGCKTAK